MKLKQQTLTKAALYCRLSVDDGTGESSSISSQKLILTTYAKEHGFLIHDIYVDDGYSGVSFDRPSFNRMLSDIEHGKIQIVLTKDLSRLGRDHLKTGYYTEIFFPENNIRYIAVNDGIDTSKGYNDIAPFKNLLNEMYARDVSRKNRAVFESKARAGIFTASYAPLGYRKDADDKHNLIVDEETAPIVRQIFEWSAQGIGINGIRRLLKKNKMPSPAWWQHFRGWRHYPKYEGENPESPYEWTIHGVKAIINHQAYIGNLVAHKQTTIFKVGKNITRPKDEWVVVENVIPPIVDKQVWDLAHEKFESRRRKQKNGVVSIFAGLVKCADCGRAMVSAQTRHPKDESDRLFRCGLYSSHGPDYCTQHRILQQELYESILIDIRECAKAALMDEKRVTEQLTSMGDSNRKKAVQTGQKELATLKKRLAELDTVIARLYEDSALGKITQRNYDTMMLKYQTEQEQLEQKENTLQAQNENYKQDGDNAAMWIDLIRKYADIQELNAPLLNELISKIVVHEKKEADGVTTQEIEVHYRFIGQFNQTLL